MTQARLSTSERDPTHAKYGWLGVAGLALLIYSLTASRTIQWQDFGQFVVRIVTGELYNELGLALAHPLHFWLGQAAAGLLPFDPPLSIALVSAVAGALTVANVFGLIRTVTGSLAAALFAGGALLVANTFWRMSTMPECYTVTTALLSAELWGMALYYKSRPTEPTARGAAAPTRPGLWLACMMACNGLGFANHNMALLTLPASGLVLLCAWRRGDVRWRGFTVAMAAWCVGAMPYLVLVGLEAARTGDAALAVRSALFGHSYGDSVMNLSPAARQVGISAAFTLLSFPGVALPLAVVGLIAGRRWLAGRGAGGLWWAWGGALLIHVLFVLRYNVIDQHTFLLPAYTILVLFAGLGYARLQARLAGRGAKLLVTAAAVSVLGAPAVYVLTASVARDRSALGSLERHKPYRDDYRYLFVPWGAGEVSAETMSEQAVDLAAPGGVVLVADPMARFAVGYQLERDDARGVTMQVLRADESIDGSVYEGRAVVFVPASTRLPPMDPPTGFTWEPAGELYVLVADSGGGGGNVPPADNPAAP